jgi:voltage-gated potassium channel
MARFGRALSLAKEEAIVLSVATSVLLYLSAMGIYFFEHEAQPENFRSLFDSLWWAIATLTTVGYGDVYPITVGGRLFTFVVLMCGLGIVAMPAGLVAAALLRIRHDEDRE